MKRLLILGIVVGFALQAAAIDFDFYGKMRLGVWQLRYERSYDDSVGVDTNVVVRRNVVYDSINSRWDTTDIYRTVSESDSLAYYNTDFLPHGYLGVNCAINNFDLCFEFGIAKNVNQVRIIGGVTRPRLLGKESMAIYMRKWTINWHINDLISIVFGQDYSPVNFIPSEQVLYTKNSFANTGCVYGGRNPMVQFSLSNIASGGEGAGFTGGVKLAAIKPDTVALQFRGDDLYSSKVDAKMPKLEAKGEINYENNILGAYFGIAGGYNRFSIGSYFQSDVIQNRIPLDSAKSLVTCYIIAGNACFKVGPVSLDYTLGIGKNPGAYGLFVSPNPWVWRGDQKADITNIFYPKHEVVMDASGGDTGLFKILNSNSTQMAWILKVKPFDWLYFESAFGMVAADHEYEEWEKNWNNVYAYYAQFEFTVAEQLKLTPEFGQYYYGPKMWYGRHTYWGFQVEFGF